MDAKALEGQKKLVVRASTTHQQNIFCSRTASCCAEKLFFTSTSLWQCSSFCAECRTEDKVISSPCSWQKNPVVRVVPSGSAAPQHFPCGARKLPGSEVLWAGELSMKLENLDILKGKKIM